MPNVIGEFVAKIGADTKGFDKGVGTSEKKMDKFSAAFKKHSRAIGLAAAAMGAAVVAGMAMAIKSFAKAGDEVQKMSKRTGFATETLSELKHAAELSGTSLQGLEKGVKRMQMGILDANRGLKESLDNFQDLGIELDDLAGKTPEQQFEILTNALAGVEDATLRAGLAAKIFGRAGTDLLPMLAAGKEGIAAMRQEAHDLGVVFDQEAADKAASFTDTMHRMKQATDGVKFAIAEQLVPSLEPLIMGFTRMITKTKEWTEANQTLSMILNALTGGPQAMMEQILENNIKLEEELIKQTNGEANSYKDLLREQIRLVKAYSQLGEVRDQDISSTEEWIRTTEDALDALDRHEDAVVSQSTALESYNKVLDANKKMLFDNAVAAEKVAAAGRANWTTRMNQIMAEINAEGELNRARGFQQRVGAASARQRMINLFEAAQEADPNQAILGQMQAEIWGGAPSKVFDPATGEIRPKMHGGGIVPGSPGQEVPILAQAGEMITPAGGGNSVTIIVQGSVLTERDLGLVAQQGLLEVDRLNYETGIQ